MIAAFVAAPLPGGERASSPRARRLGRGQHSNPNAPLPVTEALDHRRRLEQGAADELATTHEDDHSAHDFKHVYESGLVWPSQIQGSAALAGHPGELGPGFLRVSLSSAGEPDRYQ